MTPLYDIVSAQPNVVANQIRHNKFKLAMAVGRNRHYVIGRIAARHFVESAEQAGMGSRAAVGTIDELLEICPKALDQTLSHLPTDFPEAIADSIAEGVKQRLDQLARYREAG
jgi:serine/threonine-protein kinase HipA